MTTRLEKLIIEEVSGVGDGDGGPANAPQVGGMAGWMVTKAAGDALPLLVSDIRKGDIVVREGGKLPGLIEVADKLRKAVGNDDLFVKLIKTAPEDVFWFPNVGPVFKAKTKRSPHDGKFFGNLAGVWTLQGDNHLPVMHRLARRTRPT